MTGLPIALTFTFDDMAQAERAIAAVRQILSPAPERKATGSASRTTGGEGANAGDGHVDRVASASPSGQDHIGAQPAGVIAGIDLKRTASGPDTKRAPHSEMDGGAIAAVKGQARPASVVDAEPSPSSTLNPFIAIRPHCQKPTHCSGYGRNHCHACKVTAAAEAEAA